MGKRWWCLLLCAAGACQVSRNSDDPAGASGAAGTASGSAGASTAVGGSLLNLAGSSSDPLQPSGTAGAPDLSDVPTPVVRCLSGAAGGTADGGESGAGGAGQSKVARPAGGARFDDECSPPPSICLDDLVLVYFDEGQCVAGRCEWVKQSLACRNACRDNGCQDSITTK